MLICQNTEEYMFRERLGTPALEQYRLLWQRQ